MLPPTLLLPSPPVPESLRRAERNDFSVSDSSISNGNESKIAKGDDGASQLPSRQPNVLQAQEDLAEALAQELEAAQALWNPTARAPSTGREGTMPEGDRAGHGAEMVVARRVAATCSDLAAAKLLAAAGTVWPQYASNQRVAEVEGDPGS